MDTSIRLSKTISNDNNNYDNRNNDNDLVMIVIPIKDIIIIGLLVIRFKLAKYSQQIRRPQVTHHRWVRPATRYDCRKPRIWISDQSVSDQSLDTCMYMQMNKRKNDYPSL